MIKMKHIEILNVKKKITTEKFIRGIKQKTSSSRRKNQ